jgi:hypothetical protein
LQRKRWVLCSLRPSSPQYRVRVIDAPTYPQEAPLGEASRFLQETALRMLCSARVLVLGEVVFGCWCRGRERRKAKRETAAQECGLRGVPAVCSVVSGPIKEPEQTSFFFPEEQPEESEADGVSSAAGVGFDAPFEIFASPRCEAMASCCIPEKAQAHIRANLQRDGS